MHEIIASCLNEKSKNPIYILEQMMLIDFCHMHGPEHHVMVGASLLAAYKNAGGEIDLLSAPSEMQAKGKQVPVVACGFWEACGAGHIACERNVGTIKLDDRTSPYCTRQKWRTSLL